MFPPPFPHSRITLPASPGSATWARRHTLGFLSCWRVSEDVIETVQLVVSELTTNAVRHPRAAQASSPHAEHATAQTFELTLEIAGDLVRASVWDRDPNPPRRKDVGAEEVGGRGVLIVAAVSRKWGCDRSPSRPGKVVWAEIPAGPLAAADASDRASEALERSHGDRSWPKPSPDRSCPSPRSPHRECHQHKEEPMNVPVLEGSSPSPVPSASSSQREGAA